MKPWAGHVDNEERARRDRQAAIDEAAEWRGAPMSRHSEVLEALLRLAADQLTAGPFGERLRHEQDPRSPEALELWERLVQAHRRTRRTADTSTP